MLPRHRRLHAERDIRRLLQRGARRRDALMQLVAAPSSSSISRAAVVVSKQVAKKATARNLIRRRVQALFPKLLNETTAPTDVLVRLSPAAATAKPAAVRASLIALWPIHGVTHFNPKPNHRRAAVLPTHPVTRS